MDFRVRLGANHSDSQAIARICNDAWREKTRFCVRSITKQTTSDAPLMSVSRESGGLISASGDRQFGLNPQLLVGFARR
jgi:hypothetical protein